MRGKIPSLEPKMLPKELLPSSWSARVVPLLMN